MRTEDASCAVVPPCSGNHAQAWRLTRGADFPTYMDIHSLQSAIHAKARHAGLRCHTLTTKDTIQVQFYRRTSAS
jgi:hypothetical protein